MTEVVSETPIRDKAAQVRRERIRKRLEAAAKAQKECPWTGVALNASNTVVMEYWPRDKDGKQQYVLDIVYFSRWEDVKCKFFRIAAERGTPYSILDGRTTREFTHKTQ